MSKEIYVVSGTGRYEELSSEPIHSIMEDDEIPDIDDIETDLEITERSDDIEQITVDYIARLAGIDDCEMSGLFSSKDILAIVDHIEEVLWKDHCFQIYRPRRFIDNCGVEHIVNSLIEIEELIGE